jgi:hypothetical protein
LSSFLELELFSSHRNSGRGSSTFFLVYFCSSSLLLLLLCWFIKWRPSRAIPSPSFYYYYYNRYTTTTTILLLLRTTITITLWRRDGALPSTVNRNDTFLPRVANKRTWRGSFSLANLLLFAILKVTIRTPEEREEDVNKWRN